MNTPISELGEFGLIDRMQSVLGVSLSEDVLVGIGDDAAVYHVGEGHVHVVTTDALIEGVHFDRSLTPMEYLGFKTISVNVSDVAAMNARPRYATLALGVPGAVSVEMVESFYEGVRKACEAYGVVVVGGDTAAARRLTVVATLIGEAGEDDVVYRSGAEVGDVLCVTGDVGGAYAGLKVLLAEHRAQSEDPDYQPDFASYQYVIGRQLAPVARVNAVKSWAAHGVRPHALIDISDGLASETHHLCRQSGCGALLYGQAIPLDPETRQVADRFGEEVDTYALYGGEDYELLFAVAPDDFDKLEANTFAVVGQVKEAAFGVRLQTPEGMQLPLDAQGYQHFGEGGDGV